MLLKLPDNFTSVINFVIISFVVNEWMLYVGGAIALLDSTSTTMFRSMITKLVHANEVGKVFSVVGTFQAIMPFIAGPMYGFLYRSTVSYQPAAFLFLIIAIKSVVFVIVLFVTKLMRTIIREQRKNDDLKKQLEDFKKRNNIGKPKDLAQDLTDDST